MLRALVLLLILANAAAWAWHEGWLPPLQDAAVQGEGRERRQAQINPDRLEILRPATMASGASSAVSSEAPLQDDTTGPPTPASLPLAPVSASAPQTLVSTAASAGDCWQAGPFSATERAQVVSALEGALPSGSWALQAAPVSGLWLVYMGPFADAEAVERKQTELRRIRNLNFEEVRSPPSLALGISLGRYTQEDQAEAALEALRVRGIRTARVVTVRPAAEQWLARVPSADGALARLVQSVTLPGGRGFAACR
jgi:hypothetical protein